MKKALALAIVLMLFVVTVTPVNGAVASDTFSETMTFTVGSKIVRVNGVVSYIPVAPIVESGRVFIPLRSIGEKFKASVTWDDFTGRIDVRTEDKVDLEFKIGDKRLYVTDPYNLEGENDWYQLNMDVAPFLKNGSTFVPLKYFAEGIGSLVSYDARSKTVTIKKISTAGWKTYREPHTGAQIKFPGSWTLVTEKSYLEIYNNGTDFIYSYEDKTPEDIISSAKELYLPQGWKLARATSEHLKFTKSSGTDQLIKIISVKKFRKGSLVYTVNTLAGAPELDLLICDKILPGPGI